VNGGRTQIGPWDASGATYTHTRQARDHRTVAGVLHTRRRVLRHGCGPRAKQYLCTSANTWTQQSTGTSTFLQLGTGAVVRTVTSKLQDVVHVKDFGAKGDGVTDDSAAFAAALASGAGEVRADDGTYVVNSAITLAKGQKISLE
jgi:hypothetical protein